MNPDAREFVPSWLSPPPPAEPTDAPQAAWDDEPGAPESDATNPEALKSEEDNPKLALPTTAIASVTISDSVTETTTAVLDGASSQETDKTPVIETEKVMTTAVIENPSPEVDEEETPPEHSLNAATNEISEGEERNLSTVQFDDKKPLNVVLLGHVDAGKSTISGHLLLLTGNVDERTMEKFEREAKALNRESWKFAFALDTSEQERSKGKTEEYGQASFTTQTRRFTILDAPGHKNYVPHMLGGASQADIGILVISARKGEFETGFERGGQTREHAMLAKTSGVRQMIVVINKLDDLSVLNSDGTWSQTRFNECKTKLMPYMKQVGWNPKELIWVPVSGMTGHNLKEKVSNSVCSWYNGESLLDTLENIQLPERLLTGSVKMPISEKHKEMGTMVMGKLESGVIQLDDKLTLMPNRVEVVVDALMLEGTSAQVAEPGDNVRLRLKGVEEEDVRVGFVLCSPNDLVSYSKVFIVTMMIWEHKSIICAGYSGVIHIHAAVEEITVSKLIAELDKSGKVKRKYPKFVKPGMRVVAELTASMPLCLEPYDVFPQLGRFNIRDEGKTVAVGKVMKVKQITPESLQTEREEMVNAAT